jgi:hypothetical protein
MSEPQHIASPAIQPQTDIEPERQHMPDMHEKSEAPETQLEKQDMTEIDNKQEKQDIDAKFEGRTEKNLEKELGDDIEGKQEASDDAKQVQKSDDEPQEKVEDKPEEKPLQNDTNTRRLSSGTESDDTASVG